MARRRESLGNVEASRSERYTGAGIVDSDVESERDTVPIFDNGGRICMLFFARVGFLVHAMLTLVVHPFVWLRGSRFVYAGVFHLPSPD